MKTSKWFYRLQEKTQQILRKDYEEVICQWQDVCKSIVYENFICYTKDRKESKVVLVCLHKQTNLITFYLPDVSYSCVPEEKSYAMKQIEKETKNRQ